MHITFKSVCIALGLLDDDNEWHEALAEASNWASATKLRHMYCTMLMFSDITNPVELWEHHWKSFTDDIQYRIKRDMRDSDLHLDDEDLKNLGLLEIEHILNRNGRSLKDFPPMPLPSSQGAQFLTNRLIREEMEYDSVSEKQLFNELHSGLNSEQLEVYDTLHHLQIAALLLPGGRTAHSRFKIPINLDEFSSCSINQQTELAKLIQEASLIIWDEAPMYHRYGFEAVDRTFKDILKGIEFCSTDCVFGGKLFILGGDFRQILPVVPKGRREATIAASLKELTIWNHCRVLHLRTNMRIMAHDTSIQMRQQLRDFANWILMIGDGKIPGISFIEGGGRLIGLKFQNSS
ncbi:uncharacterized protein LOC114293082 [Camellia sinensis]|uniref:uncharacterized protein LOC114293082 n=1 Tax=Camellia sinensis TaxID=4442 RepID=UPI001036BE11|nr:uncharacterized protein LOC114293082 [Camellia sinensis]